MGATYPFRYTGQKWDAGADLYYYKARHYDPRKGRFIQPDPIGYGDGLNMYAYVGNDPLNGIDPTGTSCTGTRIQHDSDRPCTDRFTYVPGGLGSPAFGGTGGSLAGFSGSSGGTQTSTCNVSGCTVTVRRRPSLLGPIGREIFDNSPAAQRLGGIDEIDLLFLAADATSIAAGLLDIAIGGPTGEGVVLASILQGAKRNALKGIETSIRGITVQGFTRHGVNRSIGDGLKRAGVSPKAFLDTVRHPTTTKSSTDSLGRRAVTFIGRDARVVVNPQTGRVISVNPLSKIGVRGQ